jgi:uracil DNA glycosylase
MEENKLDFESFREKLGEWADKFKSFIESKAMWDLMQRIKNDAVVERVNKEGKKVYVTKEIIVPKSSDTFRAFSTTRPSDIKVIFILMDPYPRAYKQEDRKKPPIYQATGIAMDCSNTPDGKLQPSLDFFYDAIEKELGKKIERNKSLLYLHEQGVMMYNSDLTCKLNKTESHKGYWEPFQKYFLQEVMYGTTGIIYVLCGDASKKLKRYINPLGNYIFELTHPSSAQYGSGVWDSKGIFTKINKILKDNNNFHVFWDKRDWDEYKKPPF